MAPDLPPRCWIGKKLKDSNSCIWSMHAESIYNGTRVLRSPRRFDREARLEYINVLQSHRAHILSLRKPGCWSPRRVEMMALVSASYVLISLKCCFLHFHNRSPKWIAFLKWLLTRKWAQGIVQDLDRKADETRLMLSASEYQAADVTARYQRAIS